MYRNVKPQNLNSLLRLVVAKWTFAVWFHAPVTGIFLTARSRSESSVASSLASILSISSIFSFSVFFRSDLLGKNAVVCFSCALIYFLKLNIENILVFQKIKKYCLLIPYYLYYRDNLWDKVD